MHAEGIMGLKPTPGAIGRASNMIRVDEVMFTVGQCVPGSFSRLNIIARMRMSSAPIVPTHSACAVTMPERRRSSELVMTGEYALPCTEVLEGNSPKAL